MIFSSHSLKLGKAQESIGGGTSSAPSFGAGTGGEGEAGLFSGAAGDSSDEESSCDTFDNFGAGQTGYETTVDSRGRTVVNINLPYVIWPSELDVLSQHDDEHQGTKYVTSILIDTLSGSTAEDSKIIPMLNFGMNGLEVYFEGDFVDQLPYDTSTMFKNMISNGNNGRVIAADYERVQRKRTLNKTDKPVYKMEIALNFKARKILTSKLMTYGLPGRRLQARMCDSCQDIAPVQKYYIQIREDRDDVQRTLSAEMEGLILSPKFSARNSAREEGEELLAAAQNKKSQAEHMAREAKKQMRDLKHRKEKMNQDLEDRKKSYEQNILEEKRKVEMEKEELARKQQEMAAAMAQIQEQQRMLHTMNQMPAQPAVHPVEVTTAGVDGSVSAVSTSTDGLHGASSFYI